MKPSIDVRGFIQAEYTPYTGDDAFLASPTKRTQELSKMIQNLLQKERENGGVLSIDADTPATITSHKPGYIKKDLEKIVGLQTDEPLKRAIKPLGGVRLVKRACEVNGFTLNAEVEKTFSKYTKTHNDSVFAIYKHWDDFYLPDGKMLRSKGLITGLPDNYGRGRIIGDYRRVALYGIDALIAEKKAYINEHHAQMLEEDIRVREEVAVQITALEDTKAMAEAYGFDISKPAQNFTEAVQWLYFGYLAAVKEQDGAAMSLGRIDAFLDIYAERDLQAGTITEQEVQEIIDDFVIKLRLVRQLRVPEYNEIFAGDPTWVTCALGGQGQDGRTLVTKTTFRLLHTLKNLGASPEPNLTVLWSTALPQNFKNYACQVAIESSAIQFENDDLMQSDFGDDYGIACCVSAMKIGKQMQFFGARCNVAKLLLLAINQGKDELDNATLVKGVTALPEGALGYELVYKQYKELLQWIAKKYVATMNIIHYVHDRRYYEGSQMALHDTNVERLMAFGIAGFSVAVDSLSAIKYAKVIPVRNEHGVAVDFTIEGEFPTYGTDDDRVDSIAVDLVKEFMTALRKYPTYRNARHTLSLLTITSNVMYGKHTGATPDGRKAGEAFAPGANPMHNRDKDGALSSLNSVAKIPYEYCTDGISNTFSITPSALGKLPEQRIENLRTVLDGYFAQSAHHLNVNVLQEDLLRHAMEHPEEHPQLTIRVSGYAVRFISLSKEQQLEVLARTFHQAM